MDIVSKGVDGWLEFNVPFLHKYGYTGNEKLR